MSDEKKEVEQKQEDTEPKKVMKFRKQKEEEVSQEPEVIEVPADIHRFCEMMNAVRHDLGQAQECLGNTTAYEGFIEDLQAAVSALRDIEKEVLQLHELEDVLKSAKFTNKSEVDAKIRKRVISELTKHFKFTRVTDEPEEDVVVVDDSVPTAPVVEKPQPTPVRQPEPQGPSRNLQDAAALRRQARVEALGEGGSLPGAALYAQAFDQDNAPVDMDAPYTDDNNDLDPEERAAYLQAMGADPDIAAKVEQLKRSMPKRLGGPKQRGKHTSIQRRS